MELGRRSGGAKSPNLQPEGFNQYSVTERACPLAVWSMECLWPIRARLDVVRSVPRILGRLLHHRSCPAP
eukprot:scaffold137014_cov31-Tisochrysis_lutea.AAC.1